MNRIKNIIRTEQQMVFIFLSKLLKRAELREKINAIEHNGVTTRKIMFRLSLRKVFTLLSSIIFLVQY